jgi:hypothetical protein
MGKVAATQGIVKACVPRHGGGFLIICRNKLSGVSPVEIPEGRIVTIRDGLVEGQTR